MSSSTIGEVIEASTAHFVAQCLPEQLYFPPAFGSLVRVLPRGMEVNDPTNQSTEEFDPFAHVALQSTKYTGTPGVVYGVVTLAQTSGIDPQRRPSAYGLDEDRLEQEQPQIRSLLSTIYNVTVVGHIAKSGHIVSNLPPIPVRLHAQVRACSKQELIAISDASHFVRRLLEPVEGISVDDLVVAVLLQVAEARQQDSRYLICAGKQLALSLKDEPTRLQSLLERLEF